MAKIDTFGMEFEGVPPEISDAALYPFIVHLGRIEAEYAFGLPRARRFKDEHFPRTLKYIIWNLQQVNSPIEAPMAIELCFILMHPIVVKACEQYGITPDFQFRPQEKIGNYTVDFLITATHDGITHKLAIECDGHDFHERTKEQAAHDRKRDRALLTEGCPTLRFTGSEIWKDPVGCGDQVAGYLATWTAELAKRGQRK